MATIHDLHAAFLVTNVFPRLEGTLYWDDIRALISEPEAFETYLFTPEGLAHVRKLLHLQQVREEGYHDIAVVRVREGHWLFELRDGNLEQLAEVYSQLVERLSAYELTLADVDQAITYYDAHTTGHYMDSLNNYPHTPGALWTDLAKLSPHPEEPAARLWGLIGLHNGNYEHPVILEALST
jgi:hypothetical protein